MNVKIDTKEKFTVLTPDVDHFTANMTGKLQEMLESYLSKDIPHLVLNLAKVQSIDIESGEKLAIIQQQFYERNCSLVICEMQANVEDALDKNGFLETMNVTPTESEAWDIIQMEEIERELMDSFDDPPTE